MKYLIPLLFTTQAFCQVVEFGNDTKTLMIVYGKPTIVRFPTDVKTVSQAIHFAIKPADSQQPNYSVMAISPRATHGADDVTFILSDSRVLHAKLVILKKSIPRQTDSVYEVKTKEEVERTAPSSSSEDRLSELELLRAIINGKKPRGFQVNQLSKEIDLGLPGIACRLIESYNGSDLNGYVFEITNKGDRNAHVNLSKLSLESDTTAVLSQIDSENLTKNGTDGSQTFLRVISRNEKLDELLPFAPIDEK